MISKDGQKILYCLFAWNNMVLSPMFFCNDVMIYICSKAFKFDTYIQNFGFSCWYVVFFMCAIKILYCYVVYVTFYYMCSMLFQ